MSYRNNQITWWTYLVVDPRNLLASSLVPDLTFRDQPRLDGHDANKNWTDSDTHEGQLPTPNHGPNQANTHHGHDDHELAHDNSHEHPRVISIFYEDLRECGRGMCGRVKPGFVLR